MDQVVGQAPQYISRAGDVVNVSQAAAARQLSVIVPQLLLAIVFYPVVARLVALLDRLRLLRVRRLG